MVAETIIPDGTTDFSGGQNAGVKPHALLPNQYYIGVNVSAQSTSLSPRWPVVDIPLDFSETGNYRRQTGLDVTFESIFKYGKFQAFAPYGVGADKYFLYVVSGFIFLVNETDGKVVVLNSTDPVNMHAPRINWSTAGNYFVIFDWPNYPIILTGISAARADPTLSEVPVSVMGCYNQNRLCISNAGIDWTAGDPSGSPYTPTAPISFLEVLLVGSPYLADVYQIPTANKYNEHITAMGYLQVVDTSTGIGPLLVSTQNALYSYRTDLPRVQWQGGAGSIVFGSMLLPTTGIVGQRAHTNVGSDVLFLGKDGQMYALSMARNDQRRWGNSPISREVKDFLIYNDSSLAPYSAVKYFKNKIFATANPHRVDCISPDGVPQTDYVSAGLVVMELDSLSGLLQQATPIWSGLWTGVLFTDFAEVDNTLYISGKLDGENKLFKFDPSRTKDRLRGEDVPIRSVIVTREYDHTDGTVNKELHSLDLGMRSLEETVKVSVDYRPSTTETFKHWKDREFFIPVSQCGPVIPFANGLVRQGIRDLTLGGVEEEACLPGTNDLAHVYKGVQLRIVIEGTYWELDYIKLKGRVLPRNELETDCSINNGQPQERDCFNYWAISEGKCK